MALSVVTNTSSLNAQRNLTRSGEGLATSMQRLSSGMRINSAKDDAAGLQISNRLTSQTCIQNCDPTACMNQYLQLCKWRRIQHQVDADFLQNSGYLHSTV